MNVLTVRPPWSWAIVHGDKPVENRSGRLGQWRRAIGPLWIHAALQMSERGMHSSLVRQAVHDAEEEPRYHAGKIVGLVDVVDVHESWSCGCSSPWAEWDYVDAAGTRRNNLIHLVLERPRPIARPIQCRGRLGLWTPPADVSVALLDRLH